MSRRHQNFRNYRQEQRLTQNRVIASAVFVLIMMAVLLARLFYLQVVQHEIYQTKADDNRVMLITEPPPRGLIYDRNGLVLADNRPIHSLTVIPERVEDIKTLRETLSATIDITDSEWDDFNDRLAEYRRPYQSITLKSQLTDEQWAKISVDLYRYMVCRSKRN